MAELLIKLESADNPTDLNAWGKGHVVCVQEDGWKWGKLECPPKFCVVHVSDMPIEEAKKHLEPEMSKLVDINSVPIQSAIRKTKFDLEDASISKSIKDDLKGKGKVSVTTAQIKGCIKAIVKDGK